MLESISSLEEKEENCNLDCVLENVNKSCVLESDRVNVASERASERKSRFAIKTTPLRAAFSSSLSADFSQAQQKRGSTSVVSAKSGLANRLCSHGNISGLSRPTLVNLGDSARLVPAILRLGSKLYCAAINLCSLSLSLSRVLRTSLVQRMQLNALDVKRDRSQMEFIRATTETKLLYDLEERNNLFEGRAEERHRAFRELLAASSTIAPRLHQHADVCESTGSI